MLNSKKNLPSTKSFLFNAKHFSRARNPDRPQPLPARVRETKAGQRLPGVPRRLRIVNFMIIYVNTTDRRTDGQTQNYSSERVVIKLSLFLVKSSLNEITTICNSLNKNIHFITILK